MATAYGCAGTSSGSTRIGVWQARTKSRVTVKTKSGLERYILSRNAAPIALVTSRGGRRRPPAPRPPAGNFFFVKQVGHLGTETTGLRQHGSDDALRCPPQQVP